MDPQTLELQSSIKSSLETSFPGSSIDLTLTGSCTTAQYALTVVVVSDVFIDMSRLDRQKCVNKALGKWLDGDDAVLHSVKIKCKTP